MDISGALWTIIGWLRYPIFQLGGKEISLLSMIVVVALLWGFIWLSKWIERLIHKTLLYKDMDPGVKGSIEKFSRYFVVILGVLISLGSIGINMSSLTAFGAVLTVGISFGLQNITHQFISGLIILIERPIKKGDIVQVGGVSGRVLDIKVRFTLILTRDDIVIIVPNSQFTSEHVINDSFSGDKLRMHIKVGVAYGSDVDKVTQVLLDVAKKHEKVLKTPPPTVTLDDFGNSSLDFSLRIWTSELWFYDILLSEIRYDITRGFEENGIRIPFPQQDLHLRSISEEAAKKWGT